jgi:hypothetical protein
LPDDGVVVLDVVVGADVEQVVVLAEMGCGSMVGSPEEILGRKP